MKNIFLAATCVLALSTVGASAQSSQGNVGPGTSQAGSMGTGGGNMNNNMGNTTGSGMSDSKMGSGGAMKNNMGSNPSSQGNVGPGTTPGNPGSSSNSK